MITLRDLEAGERLLELAAAVEPLDHDGVLTSLCLIRRARAVAGGELAGSIGARALADAWREHAPLHPLAGVYLEAAAICEDV